MCSQQLVSSCQCSGQASAAGDLTHNRAFLRDLRDKGQPFPLTGLLWAVFAPEVPSGWLRSVSFVLQFSFSLGQACSLLVQDWLIYNNIFYSKLICQVG